jgi:hypothetical protein
MLLAGLVVFFTVVYRGGPMCVCRLFVKFRSSLMKIVGHDDPFYHTINRMAKILMGRDARGCTVLNMHCDGV